MLRKLKYILFLGTLLLGTAALAAPYPLEITQPQPNLNTKSRFYKAYPGLEYNVRPAVFGGAYPFTHTLTNAPAGMTINARTGEITWPNPTTAGSPHAVTLKVTDSEGAVDTVSWTITVTTQGFGFVDAVNGKTVAEGGTGTITNPWKTMNDWYRGNKDDATYAGWFLYYRAGTYHTNTMPAEDGLYISMGNNKPVAWLAYPGESPAIDIGNYWLRFGAAHDQWFSGLRFQNALNSTQPSAIRISAGANRVMFYKNHFYRIIQTSGSLNQSFIMRFAASPNGLHMAVLDNVFERREGSAYALLGYNSTKAVVEGNTLKDFRNAGHGIGPKAGNQYWSIRANTIVDAISGGEGAIWLMQSTYNGVTTRDIEICYNNVRVTSGVALKIGQTQYNWGAVHAYRNTLYGGVLIGNMDSTDGPVRITRNVIINSDSPQVRTSNGYSGSSLVIQDNLMGSSSSGIIDTRNMLTTAYLQYLGIRGHQIDQQSAPLPTPVAAPSPPVLMEVR